METIMRRQSKYKQTLLSTLFIEAFFLLLGRVVEPIPVARFLVDVFAEAI
jgi:hypothetical protein